MNCHELNNILYSIFDMSIKDYAINGLQVENKQTITNIAFAVDANLKTIEKTIQEKSQALIVHHGIFWDSNQDTITDIFYKKISLLIENDIALFGIHLPLDIHSQLGNNIQIIKQLNILEYRQNITYKENNLGFSGLLEHSTLHQNLLQLFSKTYTQEKYIQLDNASKNLRLGVSSGSFGSNLFIENKDKAEIFLVGETNLPTFNLAQDNNKIIVPLGHYFTEVFGIQALQNFFIEKYPNYSYKFIDNEKFI